MGNIVSANHIYLCVVFCESRSCFLIFFCNLLCDRMWCVWITSILVSISVNIALVFSDHCSEISVTTACDIFSIFVSSVFLTRFCISIFWASHIYLCVNFGDYRSRFFRFCNLTNDSMSRFFSFLFLWYVSHFFDVQDFLSAYSELSRLTFV